MEKECQWEMVGMPVWLCLAVDSEGCEVTKLELLQMANRFYPDGALESYFDEEGNFV